MGKLHLVYLSARDPPPGELGAPASDKPPAAAAALAPVVASLPLSPPAAFSPRPTLARAYEQHFPYAQPQQRYLASPISPPVAAHGWAQHAVLQQPLAVALPAYPASNASAIAATLHAWTAPATGAPAPAAPASSTARIYACAACGAHLAHSRAIVSKQFQGHSGRAYLFAPAGVVNVREGAQEERRMTTGLHTVTDAHCVSCDAIVGWRYVYAFEAAQKYKEGKYILERALIADVVERDDDADDDDEADALVDGTEDGDEEDEESDEE